MAKPDYVIQFPVLGVDPGGTTGFAMVDRPPVGENKFVITKTFHVVTSDRELLYHILTSRLPRFRTLVLEDYHGGIGGGIQSHVNQLIGITWAVGRALNANSIVQENIKRQPFIADSRALLGKVIAHRIDALAHVLSVLNQPVSNFTIDANAYKV